MSKTKTFILLLLILALASFLRLWQIDGIPPGLYPDEAMNGQDALSSLETGQWQVFYPENNGREGLFIWLIASSFKIFGPDVWSLRLVSALIGILTVLGMYLLTKTLLQGTPFLLHPFREKGVAKRACLESIALLSSFFLAISFWHINFSRIGFRAILVPFCLVWAFYFLFKGMKKARENAFQRRGIASEHGVPTQSGRASNIVIARSERSERRSNPVVYHGIASLLSVARNDIRWGFLRSLKGISLAYFILAGLFFGLGFYTYIAFRVALLILAVLMLFEIWSYWPRFKSILNSQVSTLSLLKKVYIKDGWWRWDVFFLIIILVVLPLGIYFIQHPQDFIGRATGVSVFAAEEPLKEFGLSALKTLGMFNFAGDWNWRHNYAGSPMLIWSVGILFVLGLILTIKKILESPRKWGPDFRQDSKIAIFLLSWFIIMLLPAILTAEGLPHALRSIGVIPVVYIFAALGLYWLIIKMWGINKKIAILLLILFLFQPLISNFNKYFFQWAENPHVEGAFRQDLVEIADYLNSLPPEIQKYVIVNEGGVPVPFPDGIPMPSQTIKFVTYQKSEIIYLQDLGANLPNNLGDSLPNLVTKIIIPLQYDQNIFEQLQKKWPDGKIDKKNGFWVFWIYPQLST